MASMVEAGDRVRIASLGNKVGTVEEVDGDKVIVYVENLGRLTTTKNRLFIASKGGN